MPYSANSELPEEIRNALPEGAQSAFRSVFNESVEDGDSEEKAFAQAWGAVRMHWRRGEDGKWVEKTSPSPGDVHVPGTEWEKMHKFEIYKADEERRMVYGWASVISKNGEPVVDTQGDVIEAHELELATTEFMANVRKTQEMHKPGLKGMVVHSFPMINDIAKSLGISMDREGWIVGVKVSDDDTWEKVKKGELRAFSIGATALREEI